jgi:uncharacterized Ntn-hydrolase superfamily protein
VIAVVFLLLISVAAPAGATWSIVAVDSGTLEVGVAGASCIGGVDVIAGIAPGRGVVAAQAMSNLEGRARAVELLEKGGRPAEILEEIASEGWDPRPWHRLGGRGLRQYAVASLDGPSQATFTGDRTTAWSGAVQASGVAVAGNMLVGAEVVEKALAAFQSTPAGCAPDLGDRLMAALWAGSAAGGDNRCVPELSALSAFVAVARPDDDPAALSLSLIVPYEGLNELFLLPLRFFLQKRGNADQNPVRILLARYHELRGAGTCLAADLADPR